MLLGLTDLGSAQDLPDHPRMQPLSFRDSIESFRLAEGFEVQLVAHEPRVVDPVTARFDHQGRMWVVEMRDYPTAPSDGAFHGRIKVLEDMDKDGIYETSHLFADNLVFPTGLQPFRDGVIVTHAGKLSYLADTDGDLIVDSREDWFTGFSTGNEQLRANHPTWLMENQVHVASGLRGGEIVSLDERWNQAKIPLSISARDFQFSPFGGDWRSVAGNSQFGFYQDQNGRNYVCSNRNPCDLLLAEAHQVKHNPLLPLSSWTYNVMPTAENSRVFPLVNAWTTSNLHAGQFTAACGVFRYESDLLAPWLDNDFFACEPTGSLIQRYRTTNEQIVPTTEPAHQENEFVASTDPWFRPVDLIDGPDGALYIVDMHRAVIEHPDWMPDELKERQDLRWGETAGRIYRVTNRTAISDSRGSIKHSVDFGKATNSQLLSTLSHPNRWARLTAARLIAQKLHAESLTQPRSPGPLQQQLRESFSDALSLSAMPNNIQHAVGVELMMWLLLNEKSLTDSQLNQAAKHSSANVKCQVIRIVETFEKAVASPVTDISSAELSSIKQLLANDSDARVRFQWLMSFAVNATAEDIDSIVAIAVKSQHDELDDRIWLGKALSLLSPEVAEVVAQDLLNSPEVDQHLLEELVRRLGWEGKAGLAEKLLANLSDKEIENFHSNESLLDEYIAGMILRRQTWQNLSAKLSTKSVSKLEAWLSVQRADVLDESLLMALRVAALSRLIADASPETIKVCRQLLSPDLPQLFAIALQALEHNDDSGVSKELVDKLVQLPPNIVGNLLQAIVRNPTWTPALLDGLEAGRVPFSIIDPATRSRLARHPNKEIAAKFNSLIDARKKTDDRFNLAEYAAALATEASVSRGKELFAKHCAACHRIADQGFSVGPDISDLRTQTPSQILTSILDPNAAIDSNFFRYTVLTLDGQVLEGLLVESNPDYVTLKMQEEKLRTIQRSDIELFQTSGLSMMPEGFENQLPPADMRDLIGYLKQWRFEAASIPLSQ